MVSVAATAALLGGLATTQLATASGAFAYDSGADLNTVLAGGFMYDKNSGKVMSGGLSVDFGNRGPEATKATVTVTAVKNIRFDGKPKFDKDANDKHNFTVVSVSPKKVVVTADLAANGDEIETMDIPAHVYGKKQTLRSTVKGDKTDPDTSNNTKTGNYSVDAPEWNPNKPSPKPTDKPTGKPTAKPTEKPTEKPTAKPSEKPGDDSSEGNTPAPAGDSDKGGSDKSGDLAETGSSSNTPLLVGGAGALVVIGGLAVFAAKRKKAGSQS
jgi:LPXTG-motif cell wall-anchored protein